jgi:hypothetical protein
MANVEAPSTFMTSYQQGRQNKRQDRQDNIKLGFTIFDEDRRREKHKAQMDRAMEDTRHLKTMNPFLESLERYKNELKWSTLESDVIRNKDATKHQVISNVIKENDMRSDLDNIIWQRMQNPDLYGRGGAFSTEEKGIMAENRGLLNRTIGGALGNQATDQDIEAIYKREDLQSAQAYGAASDDFHMKNAMTGPAGGDYGQQKFQTETIKPLTFQERNYEDIETERTGIREGYEDQATMRDMNRKLQTDMMQVQQDGREIYKQFKNTTDSKKRKALLQQYMQNRQIQSYLRFTGGQSLSPMDKLLQNMKGE